MHQEAPAYKSLKQGTRLAARLLVDYWLRNGHEGNEHMTWLVWTGTVLALCGLALVLYCIFAALRVRRSGLPDEQMKARLQRVVIINMVALLISALGLMSVVFAVIVS